MVCYTVLHYATVHCTTLHYATLYYTILLLYYTTLYYTILYYTVLYYTISKGSLRFFILLYLPLWYFCIDMINCSVVVGITWTYWVSGTIRRKLFLLLFEKGGDPIECLLYCTLKMILLAWRWPFTVETWCRNVTWVYI